MPQHPGRVVTACLRAAPEASLEIVEWRSVAEAAEAARELFERPCGRGCVGRHVLVYTDANGVHTRGIPADPPPPPRAEELAQCYPRLVNGRRIQPGAPTFSTTPALWPKPSILNLPLPPRGVPMNPETERAQHAAVAAAGRELTPEPGGLNGRAVRAHDEAEALKRNGADLDEVIGAEMLAAALTDAALSEPESVRG